VGLTIRPAEPADYDRVIRVVDEWWGGRQMADMLPRLFFDHFSDTCFVADDDAGRLAGFIVGFLSQSKSGEAYVHFVGVAPEHRRAGLANRLYERFFEAARAADRDVVHAVTSPVNAVSIAAHRAMGFEVVAGSGKADGVAFHPGYDGDGRDRVLFERSLKR
jgi:ribosomal protein S18 acetylase RimI-like enzyme